MEWQFLVRLVESGAPAWIFVGLAVVHAVRDIVLGIIVHVTSMDADLVDARTRRWLAKQVIRDRRCGASPEALQAMITCLFNDEQSGQKSSAGKREPPVGDDDAAQVMTAACRPWWRGFWPVRRMGRD
jgi:hypothetical protein